ncbi:MAG: helix-turn-helix domain-containing protein [Actinomycetota bacterium]|nr:helix-turn-helix domain-containing protein [Actinomycetota bacterium]
MSRRTRVRDEIVAVYEREPFFTPCGLGECLNLSERIVRGMLADGKIASYLVEGSRRIAAEDVDLYLASRRDERKAA